MRARAPAQQSGTSAAQLSPGRPHSGVLRTCQPCLTGSCDVVRMLRKSVRTQCSDSLSSSVALSQLRFVGGLEALVWRVMMALWHGQMTEIRHISTLPLGNAWGMGVQEPPCRPSAVAARGGGYGRLLSRGRGLARRAAPCTRGGEGRPFRRGPDGPCEQRIVGDPGRRRAAARVAPSTPRSPTASVDG